MNSYQLDNEERGFSYMRDSYLDMRYDQSVADMPRASDLLNTLSEEELTDIFFRFGEEKRAAALSRHIVARRETKLVT